MKNPVIIGSLLPLAGVGTSNSLLNMMSAIGTSLTPPEAQVISAIITFFGSVIIAYFMNFAHSNKNREIVTYSRTSPAPLPSEIVSDIKKEVNTL